MVAKNSTRDPNSKNKMLLEVHLDETSTKVNIANVT